MDCNSYGAVSDQPHTLSLLRYAAMQLTFNSQLLNIQLNQPKFLHNPVQGFYYS